MPSPQLFLYGCWQMPIRWFLLQMEWKFYCSVWTFKPREEWHSQSPCDYISCYWCSSLSTLQAQFQYALSAHVTNKMNPSGADSKGVVLLGDSAGAHFHIPPEWMTVTQMSAVRDHIQSKPLIAFCFLCCAAGCQGETRAKCFTALEFVVTISHVSVPSHSCPYEDKKSTALCCSCSSDICATGSGKSLAAVSWCCARDTNQDIWLSMHMPAA